MEARASSPVRIRKDLDSTFASLVSLERTPGSFICYVAWFCPSRSPLVDWRFSSGKSNHAGLTHLALRCREQERRRGIAAHLHSSGATGRTLASGVRPESVEELRGFCHRAP